MNALIKDLERCNAMSALWDDAASALSRRDYAEFDRAMHAFRELRNTQGSAGAAKNQRANNRYE